MQRQIERRFPSPLIYSLRTVFRVRLNSSCLKFQRKKDELFLCKHSPQAGLPDPVFPVSTKGEICWELVLSLKLCIFLQEISVVPQYK